MENTKLKNIEGVFIIKLKNILLQAQIELTMVKKEQHLKGDQRLENIEETLTRTEQFIMGNQKVISIVVGVIVVIILGYFGYSKYYLEPKTTEAQEQMFTAQQYFESDSLDKALYGDGNSDGFIDIIDAYGMTKPGNLANYYAGICFLKKGDFAEAIDYLSDFTADDKLIAPMAKGAIGDAYLELNDAKKAAAYYMEAANQNINDFTTPLFLFKAGQVYEIIGEYKKAENTYTQIKNSYRKSKEAKDIDRYITRAQVKAERK